MEELLIDLKVQITRRTVLKKLTPIKDMLDEGMQYDTHEDEYIAYHPEHIGRGIRIQWNKNDPDHYGLSLSLPSTDEEIENFRYCIITTARRAVCEVLLNGKPLAPKDMKQVFEQLHVYNLQLLHSKVKDVLNDDIPLVLQCAKKELTLDMDTAERFWAGTNTDSFRDYLQEVQVNV